MWASGYSVVLYDGIEQLSTNFIYSVTLPLRSQITIQDLKILPELQLLTSLYQGEGEVVGASLITIKRQEQFAGQANLLAYPLVRPLTEFDRDEALTFLRKAPIDAIHLIGRIEDHGMVSAAHRGQFFGYYENEILLGVALLGHSIVIFGNDSSLQHFAQATIECKAECQVIFGSHNQIEKYGTYLENLGRQTRLVRLHQWLVCEHPSLSLKQLQLRRATMEELDALTEIHAEMAFVASGMDPHIRDWQGFRNLMAERIERGRVWVKLEEGQIVFKVDVVNHTKSASYIEGIWVHPEYRGKGIATICVSELVHRLFRKGSVVCLVVAPDEKGAARVYEKVGFVSTGEYQSRYLKPLEA
jgi:predicted GNAT family acetyltransferase